MVNINPKDLKITIGLSAYETWTGKEAINRELSITKEEYSAAVLILHIPTGLKAYSDNYRTQIKNRDKAMEMLNELIDDKYKGE